MFQRAKPRAHMRLLGEHCWGQLLGLQLMQRALLTASRMRSAEAGVCVYSFIALSMNGTVFLMNCPLSSRARNLLRVQRAQLGRPLVPGGELLRQSLEVLMRVGWGSKVSACASPPACNAGPRTRTRQECSALALLVAAQQLARCKPSHLQRATC